MLSSRDGHSLLSQYVADAALGDGLLELGSEEGNQFLLGEGQVLSFLLPQPGLTLRRHFVSVTMPVVNECLPGRSPLTVATAELGKVVSTEGIGHKLSKSGNCQIQRKLRQRSPHPLRFCRRPI